MWYEESNGSAIQAKAPDVGVAWWAVEHDGHPAFYLSALMPGDFAPGLLPLARHVVALDGTRIYFDGAPVCGTCGEVPAAEDLEPIERRTGRRGFLAPYRDRIASWKPATPSRSCWLCSDPALRADVDVARGKRTVKMCRGCAANVAFTDAHTVKPAPRPAPVAEPIAEVN